MDRKELTSGEAEPMEYGYRIPFYSTMELFVETLTGTCFELRVSPFETVISVKAKIQRLEGIPISQQYLIWHNTELEDEYCLHDYSITDGCTLKLVLAMRGGPINTRRIAMDEPTFREMADYVDANQDEFFENLSTPPSAGNGGSGRQVTLLVYRDGDQLNFFRVVDRGDGTLTPLSESLSGGSLSNMEEEEEGDVASQQKLTLSQVVENNITAAKMKQLRSHMHDLTIKGGAGSKKKKDEASNDDNASVPAPDALNMSVVRRHLTFSPKGSAPLPKEMPKLPPTPAKTASADPLKAFAPPSSEPKQPPPSANVVSTKSDHRSKSARKLPAKTAENTAKSEAKMVPKPPKSEPEGRTTPCSEISEGEIIIQSKKAMPNTDSKAATPAVGATSSVNTISKAELLRARLNRIKNSMNNSEAKPEVPKSPTDETPSLDALWKKQLTKSLSSTGSEEAKRSPDKADKLNEKDTEDSSGKRSPRTERLLAALSNNGKPQPALQTPKKKAPVSTIPRFASSVTQGLAFNRHDMYLRSYGLLPSPEDDDVDDIIKHPPPTFSDNTVTKPRPEDSEPVPVAKPPSSKILETPHGVKYTTSGAGPLYHNRPWYDRTPRSPSAPTRNHTSTVRDNAKQDTAAPYSLFHPYQRDLKPIVRPPQGHQLATPSHPRLGSVQNQRGAGHGGSKASHGRLASTWLTDRLPGNGPASTSGYKWSTQHQEKETENADPSSNAGSKETPSQGLYPRPPSSTNGIGGLRYHGRRQAGKPPDKTRTTANTSTSAARKGESPHGKIETMSRQEAREVVDFINKAMDASILRSLVKSPSKEAFRGGSGQSSLRHPPAPFHHHGDTNRRAESGTKYAAGSSRAGQKGDTSMPTRSGMQSSMLPPVKTTVTKKKRCFLCGKKTGLATSYTCRCGNNFCATHRYAETHDCTYDYKARGRKLLEENNPLVSAPKLPKI